MNYNAEALIFVMRPPEATVQILMNAVNGVGSIPGVGSMSPRLIPSELTGMALCSFYDARGVPTRSNVPVYLPGNTAIVISQSPNQSPPRVSAPPKLPSMGQAAAVPSPAVTFGQPFQAHAVPSKPTVQSPPPAQTTSTQDDDDETTDDPNLARELALAKVSQIRSATLQHEEKAGIEIELDRLAVTKESTHTREVAEAFQLNSMMRRELLATQSAYREEAQRMLQTMDVASRRVLEMADMVADRLKDPRYAPMPQPPPPPPNYVGMAASLVERLMDIYFAKQRDARRRRKRKSLQWQQLEDVATQLLQTRQSKTEPGTPHSQPSEADPDADPHSAERHSTPETQDRHQESDSLTSRELDEFLRSDQALDLLAKLAAKQPPKRDR